MQNTKDEITHLGINQFESFYAEHKQGVFGYLVSGLKNSDDAGDVLHDVFIKMLEKVKSGVIRSETARAYLYRIARNAMFDTMKKRSKEYQIEDPDKISYDAISDESPRIRVLFMDAISELPEDQAKLLELRLIHQRPMDEICIMMDTSRATLYRKMEKGLHVVAEFFRKKGYNPEVLEQ